MLNSNDILERMRTARSWKEVGVSVADAYKVFIVDMNAGVDDAAERQDSLLEQIDELKSEVDRLTEANRRLRSRSAKNEHL